MTLDNLKILRDAMKQWADNEPLLENIRSVDKNKIVMKENTVEWVHHQFGYYQALEEVISAMESHGGEDG